MRKTKKGSAAPQKQQTLEDQNECYTVDCMPLNVKTRSKGAVTCENDIIKVVKTMMEKLTNGEVAMKAIGDDLWLVSIFWLE